MSVDRPTSDETPQRASFDVFVSYAHADKDAARRVALALREAGLSVWFDENAIETFAGITRSINDGISCAKVLLAYYSETYPTRPACQWELTSALLAARRDGLPSSRILVVNPAARADHIQPVELKDALFATAAGVDEEGLGSLVGAVSRRVAALGTSLGEAGILSPPRWFGNRSIGSTDFVGRLTDLWRIHSALHAADYSVITDRTGSTVVQLRGLGGIGKTLAAQEYARRFGAAFPGGVFWLRAWHGESAEANQPVLEAARAQQLNAFANSLGIAATGLPVEEVEGLLARQLAREGQPFLWIVDDVPAGLDEAALQRWFAPAPQGKTLFTTRSREYESLALTVDLAALPPDEALQLLCLHRRPARGEEDAAAGIAADLGGHPLALHVAACWLRASADLSFAELRADLSDPTEDELEFAAQLADTLPSGHTASIATTLSRSIDLLDEDGRDFLLLAAVLASAPIPAQLVHDAFRILHKLDPGRARKRSLLAQDRCDKLSLSEVHDDGRGGRTVHTLVARTVRFRERDGERLKLFHDLATRALIILFKKAGVTRRMESPEQTLTPLPKNAGGVEVSDFERELAKEVEDESRRPKARDPKTFELLAAHGREVTHEITSVEGLALFKLVAFNDLQIGAYEIARYELINLLSCWKSAAAGRDHPEIIVILTALSETVDNLGLEDGIKLAEEAVGAARRVWGEEHPETLHVLMRLASSLKHQGRFADALKIEVDLLEAQRRVLGSEHPTTLTTASNLAFTYQELGEQTGNDELLRHALKLNYNNLETFRRVFGPDGIQTLTATGNVAAGMDALGIYSESYKLYTEAFDGLRRTRGEKHLFTLRAKVFLALAKYRHGDEDALEMASNVAAEMREALGPNHPESVVAAGHFAALLRLEGRLDESRALCEEVFEKLRSRFGLGHRLTIDIISDLLKTVQAQGDGEAARRVLGQLVAAYRGALSEDQAETIKRSQEFGLACFEAGEYDAAIEVERHVHASLTRTLGEGHADTLVALANLSSSLLSNGELEEARLTAGRVVELRAESLGDGHLLTVEARMNLLGVLLKEERDEAQGLERQIDADLDGLYNAAARKIEAGDPSGAREQLEPLLDLLQRVYGDDATRTLDARGLLMFGLLQAGEAEAALPHMRILALTSIRLRGADIPETQTIVRNYIGLLASLKRWDEARSVQESVVELRECTKGPTHPETSAAVWQLLGIVQAQGDEEGVQAIIAEKFLWLLHAPPASLDPTQLQIRVSLFGPLAASPSTDDAE